MSAANCGNCRFSDPNAYPMTYCHRYPPKQSRVEGMNLFPQVHRTDWCGEFKPSLQLSRTELDEILARDAKRTSLRAAAEMHGVGVGRVRGAVARSCDSVGDAKHEDPRSGAEPVGSQSGVSEASASPITSSEHTKSPHPENRYD